MSKHQSVATPKTRVAQAAEIDSAISALAERAIPGRRRCDGGPEAGSSAAILAPTKPALRDEVDQVRRKAFAKFIGGRFGLNAGIDQQVRKGLADQNDPDGDGAEAWIVSHRDVNTFEFTRVDDSSQRGQDDCGEGGLDIDEVPLSGLLCGPPVHKVAVEVDRERTAIADVVPSVLHCLRRRPGHRSQSTSHSPCVSTRVSCLARRGQLPP